MEAQIDKKKKRCLIYTIYWVFTVGVVLTPKLIYGDDILLHEISNKEVNMYSVTPDGSTVKTLGRGMFPQRSPNKNYLSYINVLPEQYGVSAEEGHLVIKDLKRMMSFQVEDHLLEDHHLIESIICYCWRPDSKSVAFATLFGPDRLDGYICVFDLSTRKTRKVAQFKRYYDYEVAIIFTRLEWSPDGKYLVFSSPSEKPKRQEDIKLINPDNGETKIISKNGYFPSFINNELILFVAGSEKSEIWTMHYDGSEKKRIFDVKSAVLRPTKIVNNRMIIQTQEIGKGSQSPFKLYLLNIKEKHLETINVENYILLCPNISPDGKKMTVFGMNYKLETENIGYYIYDFDTKNISLLKDLQYEEDRGFWWGLYLGYGNSTNWN